MKKAIPIAILVFVIGFLTTGCNSYTQKDNRPPKHIYIISSSDGRVIIHSTIYEEPVMVNSTPAGDRNEYLLWWDTEGNEHRHYLSSDAIIHISDQPIAVNETDPKGKENKPNQTLERKGVTL